MLWPKKEKVKPGDQFTRWSTAAMTRKTRCVKCALERRDQQQQSLAESARSQAINTARQNNNSVGQATVSNNLKIRGNPRLASDPGNKKNNSSSKNDKKKPKKKDERRASSITNAPSSEDREFMSNNELTLDVMVFPEYGCVEISDAASYGSVEIRRPGTTARPTSSTERVVFVYTMTMDAALTAIKTSGSECCAAKTPPGWAPWSSTTITITGPPNWQINGPLADTAGEDGGVVALDRTGPLLIKFSSGLPMRPKKSTS